MTFMLCVVSDGSVSKMTRIVSSGALNSTHSLVVSDGDDCCGNAILMCVKSVWF